MENINLLIDLIDISNLDTYPKQLLELLEHNDQLFLDYDEGILTYNDCIPCVEQINKLLANSSFLYVHYTRLLQIEVDNIKTYGLRILTPELTHRKLNHIKELGILDKNVTDRLENEANKCFGEHGRMYASMRQNMVWLTTLSDSCYCYDGIIHLLNNWGGENIYKWERDTKLLKHIGSPSFVAVRFTFNELSALLNGEYDIAYGVIKNYFLDKHEKHFEITRYYYDGQERWHSNTSEFYTNSDIQVDDIIGVFKLGDKQFDKTIGAEIIAGLTKAEII